MLMLALFALGYIAIIAEHSLKLNKAAIALFVAVLCWSIGRYSGIYTVGEQISLLGDQLNHIAQIVFFLMGAMTIVELIDAHDGFHGVARCLTTTSRRRLMIVVAWLAFFLSSVLDNLTTTILMISLLRKLVPRKEERVTLGVLVVIAANAGGAWTPIGDVTTTMLWIDGRISSWSVMQALFFPSVMALIIPLLLYLIPQSKSLHIVPLPAERKVPPGSRVVLLFGLLALVAVPFFKAVTGLPPFMGILIGLAMLWLITDFIHRGREDRAALRVPHALSKIDVSGALFFLGILLSVAALDSVGLLTQFARYLSDGVGNQTVIATAIGIISAFIDNVPLVAATMGMYPLEQLPMDHKFWHMIAYAAGTGGSICVIGSAAGIALMSLEKIDFITYFKKAGLPVLAGYLGGMGCYLLFRCFGIF